MRAALGNWLAASIAAIGIVVMVSPARAFTITATYDTSITNHPQASTIINTINSAINTYQAKIADPINVNITFARMYTGLGASNKGITQVSYTSYLSALQSHAVSLDDAVALTQIPGPGANPVNGNNNVWLASALGRALGLVASAPGGPDGAPLTALSVIEPSQTDPATRVIDRESVRRALLATERALPASVQAGSDGTISLYLDLMNLTTGPTPAGKYSLTAVVEHEIDEVLGSGSALNGLSNGAAVPTGPVWPEDLFRFDHFGNRSFTTSGTDSSYFSLDGTTLLARFNQTQGGDFSDWWSPGGVPHPAQVQDAFQTSGADPAMGVEWRMLDALGWSYGPIGTWVDFTWGGSESGTFANPYSSLSYAASVATPGSVVFIKGGRSTTEAPVIINPVTLTTVGGAATVGQ